MKKPHKMLMLINSLQKDFQYTLDVIYFFRWCLKAAPMLWFCSVRWAGR